MAGLFNATLIAVRPQSGDDAYITLLRPSAVTMRIEWGIAPWDLS
jgi:hypothetical protein